MVLVGRELITGFVEANTVARRTISIWLADVSASAWTSLEDIKSIYPRTRALPGRLVIFDFISPPFTITTQIAYFTGVVVVLGVTDNSAATLSGR
jgi:mRNA-degrading endonuclease HigB of HigAB toxin-antitoxin module